MSQVCCPSCAHSASDLLVSCVDRVTNGGTFDVRRCKKCEMAFTHPQPSPEEIGKYYESSDYAPLQAKPSGWMGTALRASRRLLAPWKRHVVRKASGLRQGTLLDIGCGTGEFPADIQRAGWTVTATELDENGRVHGKSLHGLDILHPNELKTIPNGTFDVVTLWHVVEHVHDHSELFREINRLLKPNGVCIIAVPNYECLDAKWYGSDWRAYDVPRHLWHFTPRTLESLARRHGFHVVSISEMPLDALYVSMLSAKDQGKPTLRGCAIGAVSSIWGLIRPSRASAIRCVLRKASVC